MRISDWSSDVCSSDLKSLSFPSERTVWGFNISRSIARKLEEVRWSGARLELQFAQLAEAGEITDLTDITQGIGLELKPFLGANRSEEGPVGKEGVSTCRSRWSAAI